MPEMDEISDSEAEDSDNKNESTPREPRREKYLFHVVDHDSRNESDLEEEGTEGDDEAEIENKAALHLSGAEAVWANCKYHGHHTLPPHMAQKAKIFSKKLV